MRARLSFYAEHYASFGEWPDTEEHGDALALAVQSLLERLEDAAELAGALEMVQPDEHHHTCRVFIIDPDADPHGMSKECDCGYGPCQAALARAREGLKSEEE
jgi:hypothetical protein